MRLKNKKNKYYLKKRDELACQLGDGRSSTFESAYRALSFTTWICLQCVVIFYLPHPYPIQGTVLIFSVQKCTLNITLPPLADKKIDISIIIDHFSCKHRFPSFHSRKLYFSAGQTIKIQDNQWKLWQVATLRLRGVVIFLPLQYPIYYLFTQINLQCLFSRSHQEQILSLNSVNSITMVGLANQ